jgi:SAM-dependent MidA family methyltransferase
MVFRSSEIMNVICWTMFLQWGMNPNNPQPHSVVGQTERQLAQLIKKVMGAQGGWLPFERFMALALYAPGLGYYSSGRRVIGWHPQDGSDFVTAPEMSPLFGDMLARQVQQALTQTHTDEVWEFGAGRGTLAVQLLNALGPHIRRYTIVELSGSLRQAQQQAVAQQVPEHADKVRWLSEWPEQLQGVVVGNEVLDAMPVQLLTWNGQAWLERGVALRTNLEPAGEGAVSVWCWEDRPMAQPVRPPTEHPDSAFAPGTVVEVHRQAQAFIMSLAERLQTGAAFLVDYGFAQSEFYLPQRTGGTLMCHHQHRSDADPLQLVGAKDITAHVNFTAMALAGQEAGLEVLGYTSQARFLINLGIVPCLEAQTPGQPTVAEIQQLVAAQKLLAEHEMGELFKVLGFVKGPWFDALGFHEGDRSHTL